MKICFFSKNHIHNEKLEIAIIFTVYMSRLVFVKNKGRKGWEMPGGHREKGEDIDKTGSRELCEETGASKFEIESLCDYSVQDKNHISYGRLFFAEIFKRKEINDPEVEEVGFFTEVPKDLMFPKVQKALLKKAFHLTKIKPPSCGKNYNFL